jgi:hypothetical protein
MVKPQLVPSDLLNIVHADLFKLVNEFALLVRIQLRKLLDALYVTDIMEKLHHKALKRDQWGQK